MSIFIQVYRCCCILSGTVVRLTTGARACWRPEGVDVDGNGACGAGAGTSGAGAGSSGGSAVSLLLTSSSPAADEVAVDSITDRL